MGTDGRGFAILPVLLVMLLVSAIAITAAAVVHVEVLIAGQHRRAAEALAAAEAGVELAVADLRPVADWSAFVSGAARSARSAGAFGGMRRVAGGEILLCCGRGSLAERLESDMALSPLPARRALRWRPYLWTSLQAVAARVPPSPVFLVVWTANDEADAAGGDLVDTNDAILVRAEAVEPGGPRRIVEALVGRHPPAAGLYAGSAAPEAERRRRVAVLRWREVR
jgi:hypothetical protein